MKWPTPAKVNMASRLGADEWISGRRVQFLVKSAKFK
jgi:hypothetical protein